MEIKIGNINIGFGEATLKKSYKDFKDELSFLFKDLVEEEREIKFKELYKQATGKEAILKEPDKVNKRKTEETE